MSSNGAGSAGGGNAANNAGGYGSAAGNGLVGGGGIATGKAVNAPAAANPSSNAVGAAPEEGAVSSSSINGSAAGPATAAHPAAATVPLIRNGSSFQAASQPTFLDGFYQGPGVLVAANRTCAAHDVAHVKMEQNQVSFEGASTGVVNGLSGSGGFVRMLNVRQGSVRLVGTFGEGTFVGSLSDAGCVYDYTLHKVTRFERFATLAPRVASPSPSPGSPAPGTPAGPEPYGGDRRAEPALEDHAPSQAAKQAQYEAAQRQARRGDDLLGKGRIVEARRLFEHAALAGNARGALGLGMTYDPAFLSSIGGKQAMADALVAKIWYRRAQMLGNKDAGTNLAKLAAWKPD